MSFHHLTTPAGSIEVKEIDAILMPLGKWFMWAPLALFGRPVILTSDIARFKAEIEKASATWTAPRVNFCDPVKR